MIGNHGRDNFGLMRDASKRLVIANLEHLCRHFPHNNKGAQKSWKMHVESQLLYVGKVAKITLPSGKVKGAKKKAGVK